MKKPLETKNSVKTPCVVGTGLIALDVVISTEAPSLAPTWAGGTCGNVLLALKYLGWNAEPIARLGNGITTDLLLADLRKWKLSERFLRIESDGSTPVIVERIWKDAAGNPRHSFSWRCPSCDQRFPGYKAELTIVADEITKKLRHPKVFFFDRVSAGALTLAKACSDLGALVVFEPISLGNPVQFRQAWDIAHIVKYSHERLSDLSEVVRSDTPRLIIETLGDAGLRYRHSIGKSRGSAWTTLSAIKVEGLKDAAGAGDWCSAGIISRVGRAGLKGFLKLTAVQLRDAIQYGQALASWTCRYEGARGGMYAVTKRSFTKQVRQIMLGDLRSLHAARSDSTESGVFAALCQVCESGTARRKSHSA